MVITNCMCCHSCRWDAGREMVVREWPYRAWDYCYIQSEVVAREHIRPFRPVTVSSPTFSLRGKGCYRSVSVAVLGMECFISFNPVVIFGDNDVPFWIWRSCLHNISRRGNYPFNHPKFRVRRRSIINRITYAAAYLNTTISPLWGLNKNLYKITQSRLP